MRSLGLLARRADLDVRDGDPVLGASFVAPGLRRFPLGNGHERLETIAESF
jgi:hypothetical protein